MAGFLTATSRTVSVISFLLIMVSNLGFSIFSIIELQGRDDPIFKTGIYLGIFYIVILGALFITLRISHWIYSGSLTSIEFEEQGHNYPSFIRDFYGWLRASVIAYMTLVILIIFLVVNFGFNDVDADFNDPIGSTHVTRFIAVHFFVIGFSFASFIYGIIVTYAFVIKIYNPLVKIRYISMH